VAKAFQCDGDLESRRDVIAKVETENYLTLLERWWQDFATPLQLRGTISVCAGKE
jgi:hypothetical protein